jgi:hypothetical protein
VGVAHRVDRVLGVFSGHPNWDPPTSSPSSLFGSGGGHTRLRERGWGGPSSDEGAVTVVLYLHMYFVGWIVESAGTFKPVWGPGIDSKE